MLPSETYRLLGCIGLSLFMVHEMRVASFLCATFVVPFFVLSKRRNLVLFIVTALLFCFSIKKKENVADTFEAKIKEGFLKRYKEDYLKSTGSYDLFLHGERNASRASTHNLYATMIESFGVLEIIVFWVIFLKYFDLAFSTLLLFYNLVMTSPLYFFIAFCLCWQKQKLPSYQEETL